MDDNENFDELEEQDDNYSVKNLFGEELETDEQLSKKKPQKKSEFITKEDYEKQQESYKNLQELQRQTAEELKELRDFKNRIVGKTDEEIAQEKAKANLEEVDKDPVNYIKKQQDALEQKYNEKVKAIDDKLSLVQKEGEIRRIMSEIDKDYVVDWDKYQDKIAENLKMFSDKAKDERPMEVLKSAARMAGAIKVRDKTNMPYIEGSGVHGAHFTKSEKDQIKEKILSAGKKSIIKLK